MQRRLIAACMAVWILLMMPITAFAQGYDANRLGSISVSLTKNGGKTPAAGVELSLYYVASVTLNDNNNLSYTYTDAFDNCGAALEDRALSVKLDGFVQRNYVPSTKCVTNSGGKAVFTDLPLGLYFVKQTNAVAGSALCRSFLVTVPYESAGKYVYDVNASPKTDAARFVDVTVKKVWNTDASARAADSVTVQLLRDGAVVESAVLNAQNNWQITYRNMPESDAYSVKEINVPRGFVATYLQNGYVFTVINSAALAQTGQLIWPIIVLAMAGVGLIAVGAVVLHGSGKKDA